VIKGEGAGLWPAVLVEGEEKNQKKKGGGAGGCCFG